ncbi:hypothetical protein MML48_6g00011204 [Holotrichia oblita]|uniref:Uncharacterized protein n=1 Tax=Holotrichia oblita TaxID=644536 RepID=A0ACB9SZT1_HOLOL|nr:hypothetical protein MML48_6g00011204 [Holotrichia oblita]
MQKVTSYPSNPQASSSKPEPFVEKGQSSISRTRNLFFIIQTKYTRVRTKKFTRVRSAVRTLVNKRENIPVSYDINQTTQSRQVKALVKPEDLRPYPKCSQTEQTRKRRSQKSEILTSTPLKDELEAKQFELTKKVKRKIGSVKSEKPEAKQRKTLKGSTSKINTNVKKRNGRQKASKPEECKGRKCNRRNIMTIL